MVSLATCTPGLRDLLRPLFERAEESSGLVGTMAGTFACGDRSYGLPRILFCGPKAEHDPVKVAIFAGVHGDEPAGVVAAIRFLEALANEPKRATGYDLAVYPLCNPTGYEDGTRTTRAGADLNREFWKGSREPEIGILERELEEGRFDGIITLHSDDTSSGLYGYAHGRLLNEQLLKPALRAAERVLPRDLRQRIDGFAASESCIGDCFEGVLHAPAAQRPQPFDLIFETPALAPFEAQVQATVLALETILLEYRQFIAYGQHL